MMVWVKFSKINPEYGIPLITRSPGHNKKGDCFEDWREWQLDFLSMKPSPTHWWKGEFDFYLAVNQWKKDNEATKS